MANKLNSNQRLTTSSSSYIKQKRPEYGFDYQEDIEEDIIETDSLREQVSALYGTEYDFSLLSEQELTMFLSYALDMYNKTGTMNIDPDIIPIDLKIKLNSLPIIEVEDKKETANNQEKKKAEKKEKQFNWNNSFELPGKKHDSENVIIEADVAHCSDTARDFIYKLMASYVNLAEKHRLNATMLEFSDEKMSLLISGEDAYKKFKFEKGLHYIKDKLSTSNIFISVLPQTDKTQTEIVINPNDLKIDVYRSGGAGGQHVNKTSSAVRITHIPTGIVVACQEERSHFQNKSQAMKLLYAKLAELEEQKENERMINERLSGFDASKIRTYDLSTHTLTDYRISFRIGIDQGIEKFDLEKVTSKLQDSYEKALKTIEQKQER